jgi:protocatechuate 3,4-dioxygenase beta subunit
MLLSRRDLVVGAAATAGASAASAPTLLPTSPQMLGPFYPLVLPADSDADLTQIKGRRGKATGQPIRVIGRIVDRLGNPVRGARIDLWQANALGRYDHPGDRANRAALDPHFQDFGRLVADAQGEFRFRSIKPAAYNSPVGRRTPHIHFAILGRHERLVTQMYFPGEPLNDRDALLTAAGRRDSLIATASDRAADDPRALAFRWTIVLASG